MSLSTDHGDFETLGQLRGAYLKAHDGNPPIWQYFNPEPWQEDLLHLSELGTCLRQQMLRLLAMPKRPDKQQNTPEEEVMYYQGNVLHALTCGALDWGGILLCHEHSLTLPEGWTGHFDAEFHDREAEESVLWDGKSVRPRAFRFAYTFPKPELVAQLRGYLAFWDRPTYAMGEYIDRGGSNRPRLCRIERDDLWARQRMHQTEAARDALPELPEPLTREYEPSYYKYPGNGFRSISSIKYKPSWQCEWCPYLGTACSPVMDVVDVAKYSNRRGERRLEIIAPEHEAGLHTFLETAIQTVPLEDSEE
jgi:hypothetical protein